MRGKAHLDKFLIFDIIYIMSFNLDIFNHSNSKHNGGCSQPTHGGNVGPTTIMGSHNYLQRVIQKRTISQPTLKSTIFSGLNPNNSRYRSTLYNHKTGNKIMGKVQKPADSSTRTRFLAIFGGFNVKPGEKPN